MRKTAADLDIEIVHGKVTGTGSHAEDTTVYRGQQSATVYRTPEIWLRDERTGREEHIRDHAVDGTRKGHELVIVRSAGNGALLRVANLHTGKMFDYGDLAPDRGAWTVIRADFWKLFTIYLPAVLVAKALGSATGIEGGPVGWLVGLMLNILFFACFYLGWRAAEDRAAKAEERQAAVDDIFRREGWIVDDVERDV
ncbi:hypothetical protein E2L08_15885 [Palleronia sediminis]|uniref:Uncharacterized protein n=1 Tax=Palleronia sediminis TaxID=2547833 RepID=A0A4R5ZV21_9RHOB|nr:hypothetical protein [Palleronia sediminis]TDL74890.1 hypothetical protein E2L08_15885 [Palleronia sediminis]